MKRLTIFYLLLTIFSAPAFGQGSQITQAGTAYGIASPYAGEDLFEVQTIQSGDVMYLAHNEYAPQILTHYGDTNWTIEDVNLDRGPFMNENTVGYDGRYNADGCDRYVLSRARRGIVAARAHGRFQFDQRRIRDNLLRPGTRWQCG